MRINRLWFVAAAVVALVAVADAVEAQPGTRPPSFEALQQQLHPGDMVVVDRAGGGTVVGRVTGVTDASLELISGDTTMRFEARHVRRVRLRDPIDGTRVKAAAWLGAVAAAACASSVRCRPWAGGSDFSFSGLFGFLSFCGAGAALGASAAAAIDASYKPTLFVGSYPASTRRVGIAVSLRF